jgi:hypothetical protein
VRAFGRIRLVANIARRPGQLAFNGKKAAAWLRAPGRTHRVWVAAFPPDFLLVTVLASISGAAASFRVLLSDMTWITGSATWPRVEAELLGV